MECEYCQKGIPRKDIKDIKDIIENILVTEDKVEEIFNKKRNKVDILYGALGYMQSYNGRSKLKCIAMAMGYDLIEKED